MATSKYYLVSAEALPEVILKVAEANRMLRSGEVHTAGEAARAVGISRSAFYKYRDAVTPFRDVERDRIVTMSIVTRDRPGALSAVLAIFAGSGANILTINQSIPVNGTGMVTLSFIAGDAALRLDSLRAQLEASPAVVRTEILAG